MPHRADLWSGVSAYVLAGGRSSRMGADKAFVRVEGAELIQHALRVLGSVCERTAILSGPQNFERDALLSCYARLVPDATEEYHGPVAGLLAALHDAQTPLVLLLAVDQPGIRGRALEALLEALQDSRVGAACFMHEDRPEPLPLALRRDLLPHLAAAAAAGECRLFNTVQRAALSSGRELSAIDSMELPAGTLRLVNLNTPADVEAWHGQTEAANQSAGGASE